MHAVSHTQQARQREPSVSHLPPNFGGIASWVAKLYSMLFLNIRVKKWKYKYKEIIHFLQWGPNEFTFIVCAPAPQLASYKNKYVYYIHTWLCWNLCNKVALIFLNAVCIDIEGTSSGTYSGLYDLNSPSNTWICLYIFWKKIHNYLSYSSSTAEIMSKNVYKSCNASW